MFCTSAEKDVCIAREKTRSVLSNILSALLRSGVIGYFNWQRDILTSSEWASAASACGPCRRSNPEDVKQILKRHGVLVEAAEFIAIRNAYSDSVGFILTDILLNHLKPLLYLPSAMQAQIKCVNKFLLSDNTSNNGNTRSTTESNSYRIKCANYDHTNKHKAILITQKIDYIVLDEVKEMVNYLCHALENDKRFNTRESNDVEQADHVTQTSAAASYKKSTSLNQIAETVREDADELFCTAHYPHCLVPLSDVYNFIAAECLLLLESTNITYADYASSIKASAKNFKSNYETCQVEATSTVETTDDGKNEDASTSKSISNNINNLTSNRLQVNECVAYLLISCFEECASHFTVLTYTHAELSALSAGRDEGINSSNVQHNTCLMYGNKTTPQSERKFERYCSHVNRRDEWLRGRDERDARDTYQRHVVGYGGHLPEYQYHFGRTFHIIEEDLPKLSRPKNCKSCLENQAQFSSGETVALRRNCMNEHHFKLA